MNKDQLRQENSLLKERISEFKLKRHQLPQMHKALEQYVAKSKETITQMSKQLMIEQEENNINLHKTTQKYETVLKEQINLLQDNKKLSERRENQEKKLNEQADKLTKEYETQIGEFEKKVKTNVKKIKQMSGTNIIKKMAKNKKFEQAMKLRGCNLQGLLKQAQLQQVAQQVQELELHIAAAQLKSSVLDQQLQKMSELIDTMKDLMENMQKEKQNIMKQNVILKEKIDQSQELIGKFSLYDQPNGEGEQDHQNDQDNSSEEREEEKKNHP